MTAPPVPSLAAHFRDHFGHQDHLYGILLQQLADDLDQGGPTAWICRDQLDAPRSEAVSLRLLAGLFRVVLDGQAPELLPFYPCLGGTADPRLAWPLVRPVLARNAQRLHQALRQPPQTNEVGRAAVLAVGLFAAVRQHGLSRVRLLEPGAAAGLNLNVDRYRIIGPGWVWGPADSPLTLDTGLALSQPPPPLTVVHRRGCDLAPVDVSRPAGARHLTSFVWPFEVERHRRMAAALQVAADHPVAVDQAGAARWLAAELERPPGPDELTVVWQSITQQYWDTAESEAVEQTLAAARARLPLAHLSMEGVPPALRPEGYSITEHGPTLRLDGRVIARSHHHGPPIHRVAR